MADTKKYISLDNINDLIEIVEDFLSDHNVRIPDSDKEMEEDGQTIFENEARIYGTVYGELQNKFLSYFESRHKEGLLKVANSWDSEIEEWPEEEKTPPKPDKTPDKKPKSR